MIPQRRGRCGETRKIDSREISCQKRRGWTWTRRWRERAHWCQEEHTSVLSNCLSPLSQEPCQKCPRAHSNALLEPNSRYEGSDAEWSYFNYHPLPSQRNWSQTEDRRNLSPNTSHVVPLDHKGKGHHDQDHKDKGWYDPVKAPFQECQVVDSLLCAQIPSIKSAVIKNPEKVKKNIYPNEASGKAFFRKKW